MKYVNVNMILPDTLIEELQKYIQDEYIYIPFKQNHRKSWIELSRYKAIIEEYKSGSSINYIVEKYFLLPYTILKILYPK